MATPRLPTKPPPAMIGETRPARPPEGTAEELIHAIHPHPTVNEALGEAFMAAWNGRAINSL